MVSPQPAKVDPSNRRIVAYAGSAFTVAFAITNNGSPGYEFYISSVLKDSDRAKLLHLFKLIGEKGRISNKEHFKKIDATDFFEFKNFQIRMPCYFLPNKILVITHGFIKKTGKIPKSELDRAERIKQEDASLASVEQGGKSPWKD